MPSVSLQALNALQKKHRLVLLLSMVFFLIALFALVSHWAIAYPLIAFACAFSLICGRLSRARYTEAFTRALMEQALPDGLVPSSYAASESADGLLAACGLIPDLPCVPGAKRHHVLHARMGDAAFSVGETACVRKTAQQGVRSAAGTLVTADGLLPVQEGWVILLQAPFAGFCADSDYAGLHPSARGDGWPEGEYTVLQREACRMEALPACLSLLLAEPGARPAALAAKDGTLSLFLPGAFYAPGKADPGKPVTPGMLSGFHLPALDLLRRMAEASAAR